MRLIDVRLPLSNAAFALSLLALGSLACARPTPSTLPPQPFPTTQPETESRPPVAPPKDEATPPSSSKSWEFRYTQGTYPYTITTEAEIAQFPDTTMFRPLPARSQTAWIAITESSTSVINPPAPTSLKCDSIAALFSRAQHLLPPFPRIITPGLTWRDSTTIQGCRGDIPVTITLIQNFSVVGDTVYNQSRALLVKRTESIIATGEGHEGQHRILLSSVGSGRTSLYLDITSGRLLGMSIQQRTSVTINTSGRIARFIQQVKERITLAVAP